MWYQNGNRNAAEYGTETAETSRYAQAARVGVGRAIIQHPNQALQYSAATYMFRGFTGAVHTQGARVVAVYTDHLGYRGDLPLDQLPLINKPYPWK